MTLFFKERHLRTGVEGGVVCVRVHVNVDVRHMCACKKDDEGTRGWDGKVVLVGLKIYFTSTTPNKDLILEPVDLKN